MKEGIIRSVRHLKVLLGLIIPDVLILDLSKTSSLLLYSNLLVKKKLRQRMSNESVSASLYSTPCHQDMVVRRFRVSRKTVGPLLCSGSLVYT